jgi:hypothetical protein
MKQDPCRRRNLAADSGRSTTLGPFGALALRTAGPELTRHRDTRGVATLPDVHTRSLGVRLRCRDLSSPASQESVGTVIQRICGPIARGKGVIVTMWVTSQKAPSDEWLLQYPHITAAMGPIEITDLVTMFGTPETPENPDPEAKRQRRTAYRVCSATPGIGDIRRPTTRD